MAVYDLRLASALIKEKYNREIEYYKLKFPADIYWDLKKYFQNFKNRRKINLPFASLNFVIENNFAEVIYANNNGYFAQKGEWLYLDEKINLDNLSRIIKVWMQVIFTDSNGEVYQPVREIISNFAFEKLVWRKKNILLKEKSLLDNNTVDPDGDTFKIIPSYITRTISRNDFEVKLGEERFKIRSCGDELISWPPKEYKYRDKSYFYSLGIDISLCTYPKFSEPVINFNSYLKRWVSQPLIANNGYYRPKFNSNLTLYFENNPHLINKNTNSIYKTMIRSKANKILWDENDYKHKIMTRLSLSKNMPQINYLLREPKKLLVDNDHINAALVYSSKIDNPPLIRSGFSLTDQAAVFNQIIENIEELYPFDSKYKIVRMRNNVSIKPNILKKRKARSKLDKNNDELFSRKNKIAENTGGKIKFEIIYQTTEHKQNLKEEILNILNIKNSNLDKDIFKTGELIVEITSIEGGEILSGLMGSDFKDAYYKRIEMIKNKFEKTDETVLTIVELENKDFWNKKGRGQDPKSAIREGLALTNRLSQFITVYKKEDEYRLLKAKVNNSIWDLLRQSGFLPSPPVFKLKGEYDFSNLDIYGFYVLKKNSTKNKQSIHYPVIIHLNSNDSKIKLKYPDSNSHWYNYKDVLLDLAVNSNFAEKRNYRLQNEQINKFFSKIMRKEIFQSKNPVILTESVNIRRYWSWISNKWVNSERLYFNNRNKTFDLDKASKLRIIRYNCSETPDVFGEASDGEISSTTGLFNIIDNLYFSLAEKTNTDRKINHKISKLKNLNKYYRSHKAVEIYPAYLQKNDNPENWAKFAHELRKMSSHYDYFTKLPMPLHLASKLEEYIWKV
ncbi:MAG: pPIWI_RE module domain-containing protein [Candidatus Woesearchaeota archaeon]